MLDEVRFFHMLTPHQMWNILYFLNESLYSNYHSKVKKNQNSEENSTPLEITDQSPATVISVTAVSTPEISDVVSPSSDSQSGTMSTSESLTILHNFVLPKIKSPAGKRKPIIGTDVLKPKKMKNYKLIFDRTLVMKLLEINLSHACKYMHLSAHASIIWKVRWKKAAGKYHLRLML